MSLARERFRTVLSRPDCTLAANIFDPLSARIAHMLDYEVCFLSGSVHKVANLAVPDIVLVNMSDLVDVCRRITRIADVSLMHDGEDGFGNAVNVVRSVKELEAAGVSAIEIEDAIPPTRFNQGDLGLFSQKEQVGKLEAALAARTDPMTAVVARNNGSGPIPAGRGPWADQGLFKDRGGRHPAGGSEDQGPVRSGAQGYSAAAHCLEPAGRHGQRPGVPGRQRSEHTDGR